MTAAVKSTLQEFSSFVPRVKYPIPKDFNWFPGHIAQGLSDMARLIASTDVLIEMRDARIPITSIVLPKLPLFRNPICGLKNSLKKADRHHFVVYNKVDLCDESAFKV